MNFFFRFSPPKSRAANYRLTEEGLEDFLTFIRRHRDKTDISKFSPKEKEEFSRLTALLLSHLAKLAHRRAKDRTKISDIAGLVFKQYCLDVALTSRKSPSAQRRAIYRQRSGKFHLYIQTEEAIAGFDFVCQEVFEKLNEFGSTLIRLANHGFIIADLVNHLESQTNPFAKADEMMISSGFENNLLNGDVLAKNESKPRICRLKCELGTDATNSKRFCIGDCEILFLVGIATDSTVELAAYLGLNSRTFRDYPIYCSNKQIDLRNRLQPSAAMTRFGQKEN